MIESLKKIGSKELLLEELKNSNSTFDKGIISYNVKVMNYGYTFWDGDEKFLITVLSEKRLYLILLKVLKWKYMICKMDLQ